jgi:hypothetical protein
MCASVRKKRLDSGRRPAVTVPSDELAWEEEAPATEASSRSPEIRDEFGQVTTFAQLAKRYLRESRPPRWWSDH